MTQLVPEAGKPSGRRKHTCLLYSGRVQQAEYLLSFLMEGFSNSEHCLLVCPETEVEEWTARMRLFGLDVPGLLHSGALVIATGEQWRQSTFSSITKARELWRHIEEQLTIFPGVRIAGDASWAQIRPPISADRLCHWEATADLVYEDVPVKTVCMYDLDRHAPSEIWAALRTHSYAVIDGVTYDNPHYEAVEILDREPDLNDCAADASFVESMLASLRGSTRADPT